LDILIPANEQKWSRMHDISKMSSELESSYQSGTNLSAYKELACKVSTSRLEGIVTIWPADKFVTSNEIWLVKSFVSGAVARRYSVQMRQNLNVMIILINGGARPIKTTTICANGPAV